MEIFGYTLDSYTRCKHYHSPNDVIAIKFACCGRYYPCFSCHAEHADHQAKRWNVKDFNQKAILCGNCQTEWTINEYFHSHLKCLSCGHPYNANCQNHWSLYFAPELFNDI